MREILQAFLFCFLFVIFIFGQEFKDLPINPQEIVRFKTELGFENSEDKIISYKFFDSERKLLLLGVKNIQVWDVLENKSLYSISHEIPKIEKFDLRLEVSPDGEKVILFDTFSFRIIRKKKRVQAKVFDLQSGKQITELDGNSEGVRNGFWSEDNSTLITFSHYYSNEEFFEVCSRDGKSLNLRFCKIIYGNLRQKFLSSNGERLFLTLSDFTSRRIDNWMNMLDTQDGKFLKIFPSKGNSSPKFYLSPNEKYLVADNNYNDVRVYEANLPFKTISNFGTNKFRSAKFYGFNNDGSLYAVSNQKKLQIYKTASEEIIFELNNFKKQYEQAVFSPDNRYFLADDCDKADIYDIKTQKKIYQIKLVCKVKAGFLETLAVDNDRISFHPNSQVFLTYSDKTARIWHTETGKLLQTVINPENIKTKQKNKNADDGLSSSAGWILNGNYLYVVSADRNSILIWKYK